MTAYAPPLADMRLVLRAVAGLDEVLALPGFAELTPDLVDAVLEEAGRFASEVIAPLNRVGDQEGARLENGVVRTAKGFREAYARFVEGGWGGAPFPPEAGGQGLPWAVSTALAEMWGSACLSFSLCPLLTQGAIELLEAHGSPEQKAIYLEPMVSGRWTGTMNLTEPQAGSDVGALATRAVPDGDRWRITGQKIFITWGDHDVAGNVVHMVLARTPGAPPGIHGVSLFIVPKHLPEPDGSAGAHNDVRVGSLEHKLGIHGSPTCVMRFGDDGGAIGWMVGRENHGIRYMFTMMNSARLGVGLEGTSIAERAYQQARAYAAERVQGRDALVPGDGPVPIIRHPDVRRMLLTMKAAAEATRALAYYVGARQDVARRHPEASARAEAQARVDLLVPVVKAYSTDLGVEVASIGVQVHGGMGFIEETGAAQHYRDARIAPIYEGTNGIQAMDLVGRKLQRDGGAAMAALVGEIAAAPAAFRGADDSALRAIGTELEAAAAALGETTRWLVEAAADDQGAVLAAASGYLKLVGAVTCAWLMGRAAAAASAGIAAGEGDRAALGSKLATARFYAEQMLPPAVALARPIRTAARALAALPEGVL